MLKYTVRVADPKGHYLHVSLAFEWPGGSLDQPVLSLPAWIPGSYMIREFSRHVISVQAQVDGKPLAVQKLNKDHWQLMLSSPNEPGQITCEWTVYCWDLSVRGAHVDETHAFFNGTSLFLCPKGLEQQPIELTLTKAADCRQAQWTVATGLAVVQHDGFLDKTGFVVLATGQSATYSARDYDMLIDHPVEMGELVVGTFEACGVHHALVVYGADSDADVTRICDDLKPVCETQIALFDPEQKQAPFGRYCFLLHATDKGYGGLEHRNSTALLCARADLPQRGVAEAPKGYEEFLGLCSHEYFHSWNVKRMKPAVFLPYDLTQENYTRLLWIFEGFTSYYDDLMLVRAGKMDEMAYLKALGRTISQVLKNRGRLVQSVADSSLDAWTKYYRQDENAPNSVVSYYTKGALIAFCLDSHLRASTQGRRSLDDVMRLMWAKKGTEQSGLEESEFPALVQEATGVDAGALIQQWAYSTDELPLQESLRACGYVLDAKAAESPVFVGMNVQFSAEGVQVKQVLNGSPAHAAGLSAGDVVVALDERKATESQYKRRLASAQPGDTVTLLGFRAERLMQFTLVLDAAQPTEWMVRKDESLKAAIAAPWCVQDTEAVRAA
ncbi:PDZ domain-containing protein [Limnobacter humi]|uniref:PDZ domain-containing protein n=1 Tax=Limnobacter humi TaxID=1778671 RepID=A0ABT1WKM1_9BURK|nr:PDZ domain-containing protein [Limnobacter humi]MCQ8897608.1 PDZ domain-containing protein [Limnobacter humi]